jgi:hypothetical protein
VKLCVFFSSVPSLRNKQTNKMDQATQSWISEQITRGALDKEVQMHFAPSTTVPNTVNVVCTWTARDGRRVGAGWGNATATHARAIVEVFNQQVVMV